MSLRKIAEKIPAEYRKEILELAMIENAQAVEGNQTMNYLITIWQQYIESSYQADCNMCRGRLLTNLKNLKPELVALEKEANMLKSLN